MTKARSYCFTINNDNLIDLENMLDVSFKYLIFGFETGKEGTTHIQGYVQYVNPIEFKTVTKHFPRAHIEVAKGNFQENIDYCSKDGDYYEFGDKPTEGGRLTFAQIEEAFNDPENNPTRILQYGRAYQLIKQLKIKQRPKETKFYVINPVYDAITEILEYFDSNLDMTVVTDLTQLAQYDDPQFVIFFAEHVERLYTLFPRGVPISYKYGYEQRVINPKTFIIVTETPKLYPLYKKI